MSCGVPIEVVQEIDRLLPIYPVRHSPAYVRGVINLRGEIVTVVDLRKKFCLPPNDLNSVMRIILVNSEDERVGFLVDAVDDIVRTSALHVAAPPAHLEKSVRRYVTGVLETNEKLFSLLDVKKLVKEDELAMSSEVSAMGDSHV
jgi:purine-binding chemotaxis protein CheW